MKKVMYTEKAPLTGAPYSQAIAYKDLLFVSGQGPIDPRTNEIVRGSIEDETRWTLDNLKAILEAAGSSMDKVLKVTVYVKNIDDFDKFNEVYGEYFKADKPARTALQAGKLPMDIKVEIDAVAYIPARDEKSKVFGSNTANTNERPPQLI